jgi:hypothetical protein
MEKVNKVLTRLNCDQMDTTNVDYACLDCAIKIHCNLGLQISIRGDLAWQLPRGVASHPPSDPRYRAEIAAVAVVAIGNPCRQGGWGVAEDHEHSADGRALHQRAGPTVAAGYRPCGLGRG